MSTSQIIAAFVITLVFVLGIIRFVRGGEEDDRVQIPEHVSMLLVDAYTSQEVFDWVSYVTKMVGLTYLEQMNWRPESRHDSLLKDLRTVLNAKSREEALDRLEKVAFSHNLNVEVLATPH